MLESGGSGIILKPQHDKSLAPWSSEVAVSTLDDDSEDDELEKLMGETFAANSAGGVRGCVCTICYSKSTLTILYVTLDWSLASLNRIALY